MHLEELQWFVVLAQTEHVTDAAAELGITRPTLSRVLARLEEQAGTQLFDRVNRRLRLNAYGQIMLEHPQRSIAELQSAGERIAALRSGYRAGSAGLPPFTCELVCAGAASSLPRDGARNRIRLVPRSGP